MNLPPCHQNLGHLIRMPYGCGEQNMINFAPNVFILQYLTTTRQATPEALNKLTRFMNIGETIAYFCCTGVAS